MPLTDRIGFESIIHECQLPPIPTNDPLAALLTLGSRPLVQLPCNQIPRCQRILQVLGLV